MPKAGAKKAIIVTGAARGIGKAIARRCLAEGSHVIACDKDAPALQTFGRECAQAGLPLTQAVLDVTQPADVASFFSSLEGDFLSVEGLVNNAGIFLGKPLLDYTQEEMRRVLDVNLLAALYCSQAFGRLVLAQARKAVIVNIASIAGQAGSSDAIYGVSKAALIGLTKSCAMTFAPHIRVNAVAPGLVETGMLDAIPAARLKQIREAELIKEPVQPDDVAACVYFLLSAQSAHMTDTVLDLNNGSYLR